MSDLATVQAQLASLRKRYGLALPQKSAALDAAFAQVFAGPWEEQACSAAYRLIHSLAGSSGTYGYPEISGVARAIEHLIKPCVDARAPLGDPGKTQVKELLSRLRGMAADTASQIPE